jgi:hypothetical protein
MERCYSEVQMLNYFTPIVMYCAIVAGDIDHKCDGSTKFYSETLDPVPTPTKCLFDGSFKAMEFLDEWNKSHPNKPIEYRVKCEYLLKRT